MSAPAPQEPTIEEILASIRKIMNDEGDGAADLARGPLPLPESGEDEYGIAQPEPDPTGAFDWTENPPEPEPEGVLDDGILTLTEVIDPSAVATAAPAIAAAPYAAASVAAPTPKPKAPAPEAAPSPASPPQPVPKPELVQTMSNALDNDYAFDVGADPLRADPHTLAGHDADTLMSDATANAAQGAFARLAQLRQETERSRQSGVDVSSRSLDSLVAEMLRPILAEWIEENLPRIVEKAVEREVRRLTRPIEDQV